MADDTIEIEYQLTVDDHADFSVISLLDRPAKNLGLKLLFIVFGFTLLICLILFAGTFVTMIYIADGQVLKVIEFLIRDFELPNIRWEYLLITAFCFLFCMFPSEERRRLDIISHTKGIYREGKNALLTVPCKISISSNNIKSFCDYSQSEIKWIGVEKVENNEKGLCLFTTVVSGIFIPSRFFQSDKEKQRIFEQCQKWFLDVQESQEEKADA